MQIHIFGKTVKRPFVAAAGFMGVGAPAKEEAPVAAVTEGGEKEKKKDK